MFRFKETIKGEYQVYDTNKLLEATRDSRENAMFHTTLLFLSTDFTNRTLLNHNKIEMVAEYKSFEEFEDEVLNENNEMARVVEMFITKKGNKYIYWRDDEINADYLTKYVEVSQ